MGKKISEFDTLISAAGTEELPLALPGTNKKMTITNLLSPKADAVHVHSPAEVGLANVDDTADPDKPISDDTQDALDLKEDAANKGVAGGFAPLDGGSTVPLINLPDSVKTGSEYKGAYNANTNTPTLIDGTGTNGDYYRVSVAGIQDYGAGPITFGVGDLVVYDGTTLVWQQIIGESVGASFGVDVYTAGENLLINELCYLANDGKMYKVDASNESKIKGLLAFAMVGININDPGSFKTAGALTTSGLTQGETYYASATPGVITTTVPSSGNYLRVVGFANLTTELLASIDELYFGII